MEEQFIWKFKIGDHVIHDRTGKTATILRLRKTDNQKEPAYKVRIDETSKQTKWSESRISLYAVETYPEQPLELEYTNHGFVDITKFVRGDKIRIHDEGYFRQIIGLNSKDNLPQVQTSWAVEMKAFYGKTITITDIYERSVRAGGWSWSSDSFRKPNIVEAEEAEMIPNGPGVNFPKNCVWQWVGSNNPGSYTQGSYYLQRANSEHAKSVLDDNGSTSNGYSNSNWKQKVIKVDTKPVKDWELDTKYMCIKQTGYGIFIIGKVYTTRQRTFDNQIKIVCEDGATWDIEKRAECFLKIIDKPAAKPIFNPQTIIKPEDIQSGDYVTIMSKAEAKKTDLKWYNENIPIDWGPYKDAADKIFGNRFKVKLNIKSDKKVTIQSNGQDYKIQWVAIKHISKPGAIDSISTTISDYYATTAKDFPRFKTGDRVVIRSLESIKKKFPKMGQIPEGFPKQMHKFCETTQIIQEVHNEGPANYYQFENDSHNWSEEMILDIEGGELVNNVTFTATDEWIGSLDPNDPTYTASSSTDSSGSYPFEPDHVEEAEPAPPPPPPPPPKPEPVKVEYTLKEEIKMMWPLPILLEGPVGSGKSTVLLELAEELELNYYASVMSDATTASEFKGYKNVVDGAYVGGEFREAVEFGGMFVLEELNATTSNMPIIFNTIENGYFVFADKLVEVHKDFRLCATMNTITNPKDFGGRRPLDKSVRNRFHTIIVETDFDARFPPEVIKLKDDINYYLKGEGSTVEVEPRDMSRYMHFLDKGMDKYTACLKTMHVLPGSMTTMVKKLIRDQGE